MAFRPAIEANQFLPVGWGKPLNELMASVPRAGLWQRRMAMSAWDNICENYEDEHTRNFLVTMAFLGPLVNPLYPGTGMSAFGTATMFKWGRPCAKGGAGELTQSLARFIEAGVGYSCIQVNGNRLGISQETVKQSRENKNQQFFAYCTHCAILT